LLQLFLLREEQSSSSGAQYIHRNNAIETNPSTERLNEMNTATITAQQETSMIEDATMSPAADRTDPANTNVTAPEEGTGNSILDAADDVAKQQAKRTTVGKKEKEAPKRVVTSEEVLNRAREYAATLDPLVRTGKLSRVAFVRRLSLWEDKALTRGDVLNITSDQALGISPATASTQFQFARSPRFAEHVERSTDRSDDAEARAAKKLADAQAKVKARAEREVQNRLAREAKEAERAKAAEEREAQRRANHEAKEAARMKAAREREEMRREAREAKEAARIKAAQEREEMRDALREAILKANREAREQAEREAQARIAAAAGKSDDE
jgi:hypothetical protein